MSSWAPIPFELSVLQVPLLFYFSVLQKVYDFSDRILQLASVGKREEKDTAPAFEEAHIYTVLTGRIILVFVCHFY